MPRPGAFLLWKGFMQISIRSTYKPGTVKFWQAKYERHLFATKPRKNAERDSIALENFLSRFRDRKTPDEIYVTDVADYVQARRKEGISETTLELETYVIRAFYTWLTDVQDVPTFNPAFQSKKLAPPVAI